MNIFSMLGGGVVESVRKGIGMFTGDKAEKEKSDSAENIATIGQFAAEFQVENRTMFDSLIDGLNRLPRPAIVTMVIAYFNLSWVDSIQFQIINKGLDTIPNDMWVIAIAIISFYSVAREITKSRDKKLSMGNKEFKEHLNQLKELRDLKTQEPQVNSGNSAINEWKTKEK